MTVIDTLVLDIEGTVCPITFVKETLFPYFLEKLPEYLSKVHFPLNEDAKNDPINSILLQLPEETSQTEESVKSYFSDLVAKDIKDPVLKSLQGFIWKSGYESGELKAPVYPDSIDFIKQFPKANSANKIYIYSSGSIKAQILLFGFVDENGTSVDLNKYLSGYFDITTAGYKTESTSYEKILKEISKSENPSSVLFLSDNVKEVEAAKAAGMESYIVVRPGNAPLTESDEKNHRIITSLSQLDI
ncbi:HAD-like domain-containing protein [Scheffersomyces xylosifermentans]|uniref:HAD-like domain-containing protein n=1 Tax=Scheffersomyces xylosifermentans TaxID=1304137 RepID=UPI00315D731E